MAMYRIFKNSIRSNPLKYLDLPKLLVLRVGVRQTTAAPTIHRLFTTSSSTSSANIGTGTGTGTSTIPDDSKATEAGLEDQEVEQQKESAKKLNKTSARLYRILLKSIRTIDTSSRTASSENSNGVILLQPPLNHRDYGSARLMDAQKCIHWCTDDDNDNDEEGNSTTTSQKDSGYNEHEILSFFNWWVQCDYMSSSSSSHSTELYERIDEYLSHNLDLSSFENLLERSIYASAQDLKRAARRGFRLFSDVRINNTDILAEGGETQENSGTQEQNHKLEKRDILELQRYAIESLRLMEDQKDLWGRTSISVDKDRGLRIMATSGCIGTTAVGHLSPGQSAKNRFSYRIRIENFNDERIIGKDGHDEDDDHDHDHDHDQHHSRTYQLLGRTWNILEEESEPTLSTEDDNDNEGNNGEVTVNAPTTGVVGHLPVIRPGEMFEYTSGCDLATPTGTMSGCFHMALVDHDTNSAQVGDKVDALHSPKDKLFRMPVAPFRLVAKKEDGKNN